MKKSHCKRNWYAEKPAQLSERGTFHAWIGGADRRSGVSAAAWELQSRTDNNLVLPGGAASDDADSEEYRAFVAATVGVIETLAEGSEVLISCRNEVVVMGINEWAEDWQSRGGKKTNGKRPKAWEIWRAFLSVRDARSLKVKAEHCPISDHKYEDIFEILQDRARDLGDRRTAELRSGLGGRRKAKSDRGLGDFDVVEGGYVAPETKKKGTTKHRR